VVPPAFAENSALLGGNGCLRPPYAFKALRGNPVLTDDRGGSAAVTGFHQFRFSGRGCNYPRVGCFKYYNPRVV